MKTDELLHYKALHTKYVHHNENLSDLIDSGALKLEQDPHNPIFRNICANISVQLFDEVEKYCALLDLSKRKFVELALVDLLEKARKIVAEVDPFEEGGQLVETQEGDE
jgi:hypothetical protein